MQNKKKVYLLVIQTKVRHRVFNTRTNSIKETLHVAFDENFKTNTSNDKEGKF